MAPKAAELPIRFFPGGYMRGWSEPDRTTVLLECDKDFKLENPVAVQDSRCKW
jgi:hypothetical protein